MNIQSIPFRSLAVGLMFIGPIAGCGTDTTSEVSEPTKTTVKLLTYEGYVFPEDLKAAAEQAVGATIEVIPRGDAPTALGSALLANGKPEADVLFGIDTSLLGRAQGASSAFETAELDSTDAVIDGRFVEIDSAPVCFDVDSTWFVRRGIAAPTTFNDLVNPMYKDLTVLGSPVSSSPGSMMLVATHEQMGPSATQWWKDLGANGALFTTGWTEAWNDNYTQGKGNRPIVLSYASSPPAEVVYGPDPAATPATKVMTSTCVDQHEYVAVLAGSSNLSAARKLVQFMRSTAFQGALPLSNFVYPVDRSVQLPPVFATFGSRPDSTIQVDPSKFSGEYEKWLNDFRDATGQ